MGGILSLPFLQEPLWFSYYGPIRHSEASEALDAAIASHLQEIGASSSIPIRKEIPDQIVVPVALKSNPFSFPDPNKVTINFATSESGNATLQSEYDDTDKSISQTQSDNAKSLNHDLKKNSQSTENNQKFNMFSFGVSLDNFLTFTRPKKSDWTLTFNFPKSTGNGNVSSRTYYLNVSSDNKVFIKDDMIIIDGISSSISPIYSQDESGDGFSGGNCLICCEVPASVVAFPCRHCCMCRKCSEKFASVSTHCPVCRALVHELIDCSQLS